MRLNKFSELKKAYDVFYSTFYKAGKMPVRDTEKGIWGISDTTGIYDFFVKIKLSKYKNFLDLGSGDGKVVLIASLFNTKATGIEFDKELHDAAVKIRNSLNLKAELIQGDFFQHDFSKYDIIFINPDRGFEYGLEEKLLKEMNPKAKLFVYNNIFQPRFLKKGKTFWFNQVPIIIYSKIY